MKKEPKKIFLFNTLRHQNEMYSIRKNITSKKIDSNKITTLGIVLKL